MKIEKAGHIYHLQNFENKDDSQQLLFIDKEPVSEGSTELKTVHDGTTNEEVLRVLIDRMQFLQAKMPHHQNQTAITHLEKALEALESRTEDRVAKGVEGTNAK